MRMRVLVAVVVAFTLAVAGCSSDDDSGGASDTTMTEDMEGDEGHSEEFEFGDPMEASDASRVIEVAANDDFTFTPASVAITEGETVTFRVTNTGVIPHDFTLGDAHMQDEHEAEMAEMAGDAAAMHDEPNAFVLGAGETKDMTWHMTETGEIIFGCHQPGHYAAGMKGTISITG
jgi:uncharacterized cupredoxin-like copper-binding protein